MSNIINTLKELNIDEESFITLSYSDGTDVWHINESHVKETATETETARMLARILTFNIPVYAYGAGILEDMRADGALDDYNRDGYFEDYLRDILVNTIYDGEYGLEYTTNHYDYKRGYCTIATVVQVQVHDLFLLGSSNADSFIAGFNISIETPMGALTLD